MGQLSVWDQLLHMMFYLNTVVVGVPAKKIKSRFNDFEIARLQQSKWFDSPISEIKKLLKNTWIQWNLSIN